MVQKKEMKVRKPKSTRTVVSNKTVPFEKAVVPVKEIEEDLPEVEEKEIVEKPVAKTDDNMRASVSLTVCEKLSQDGRVYRKSDPPFIVIGKDNIDYYKNSPFFTVYVL